MTALRHGTPLKKLNKKELLAVTGGEHVSRPTWSGEDYKKIGRAWRKGELKEGPRGGLRGALRAREELQEDVGG